MASLSRILFPILLLCLGPALAQESLPVDRAGEPLAVWQGVEIHHGGFGSGMARHPVQPGVYYLMTDRGPSVDGSEPGSRVFPVPGFAPRIGRFREDQGRLRLEEVVEIRNVLGEPVTGLPNPPETGGAGETALDLEGAVLPPDEFGLDPEGLVALEDGGFWVSDEYGPHLLRLDASGRTLERINPFGSGAGGRTLPRVFAHRRPGRGMEGLAITPDGGTLVGIMQSSLDNPPEDRSHVRSQSRATRILLFDLESGRSRQHIYFQEAPALSNSEMLALSGTEFLVLERDGLFAGHPDRPARYKRIYRIGIEGATDVSDPDDGPLGLTFGGRTLEQMSLLEILDAGIVPVSKKLHLDLLEELPGAYGHDKPEGFSALGDGTLEIVNDDDFGIRGDGQGGLSPKILPLDGSVDAGVLYRVAPAPRRPEGFRLQLLHASDLESRLQDPGTLEPLALNFSAVAVGLRELSRREGIASLFLSSGDLSQRGPFHQASAEVEELGHGGAGDMDLLGALGLDAASVGNHELDLGLDLFARKLARARFPFLAANLDFSQASTGPGAPPIVRGTDGASAAENRGKVAGSAWIEAGGERIGVVGAAPEDLFSIVFDPDSTLPGLDFVGGRDPATGMPLVPSQELVQEQVDLLASQGIDKIVVLAHPLDRGGRSLRIGDLRDVDIVIHARSPELLAGPEGRAPFNRLRAGLEPSADYPQTEPDAEGHPVLRVGSGLGYGHLENLIVAFDEEGRVAGVDPRSGPVATDSGAIADLSTELVAPTLQPLEEALEVYQALASTPYMQRRYQTLAAVAAPLVGEEGAVRTRDTSLGRLVADAYLWWGRMESDAPVDIALKNGGGIQHSVPGPGLTRLALEYALPFDNRLTRIEVDGRQLLAALETCLSAWPDPDGGFPHLAGVEVEFDPRRPAIAGRARLDRPSRIARLVVRLRDGGELALVDGFEVVGDLSRRFGLITNDFLSTGGHGLASLEEARLSGPLWEPGVGEREALERYLAEALGGVVDLPDPGLERRVAVFNELSQAATYDPGVSGEGAAGIVAFDPRTRRLFVSNPQSSGIDVLDLRDPSRPQLAGSFSGLGGEVGGLAVRHPVLAVAVENEDPLRNGHVAFLDVVLGYEISRVEVGVSPGMVAFSPDGALALSANEGEPSGDYSVDPRGSVSIIDLGSGAWHEVRSLTQDRVATLDFSGYDFLADALREMGVRVFGRIRHSRTGELLRDSTVSEDLEPEHVSFTPDSRRAYVSLQENNALAVIDLEGRRWLDIVPLGAKDHSAEGQGMDASDRDGGASIRAWPVSGMYQPGAIAVYRSLGRDWIVTANEGDARGYEGFSEEARVADLALDPGAYPDAAWLQADENLGRLAASSVDGDWDGDGDIDRVHSYGARSFSIRDASGALVFDSGDDFERIAARLLPEGFNAGGGPQDSADSRSAARGPAPEGLAVGRIGGRIYAFIGLESPGGIVMYDITAPHSAFFVQYFSLRDFLAGDVESAGGISPEGLAFVPAAQSPSGQPLLVAANGASGTTDVHVVRIPPPARFSLQLLHISDSESAFRDPDTLEHTLVSYLSALDGMRHLAAREGLPSLYVGAGNLVLPKPYFRASRELFGSEGIADIELFNGSGLAANGLGHHEFDLGIDVFARMLARADFPFLAANLDFSKVSLQEGTPPIALGRDGASAEENAGKVAGSSWVEIGGQRLGLIGAVPDILFHIVNEPAVFLPGLEFLGGTDPGTLLPLRPSAESIQAQVDLLEAQGIDKIVLLGNPQDYSAPLPLVRQLRGVDIVIAPAGGGLMAGPKPSGPFNLLRPGDFRGRDYPLVLEDAEGMPVLQVDAGRRYRYVGHLTATFDSQGRIVSSDPRSGLVAATGESIALLEEELAGRIAAPRLEPGAGLLSLIGQLESTDLVREQFEALGATAWPLNGRRGSLRTRETNLGRLAADSFLWHARERLGDAAGPGRGVDFVIKNSGGIQSGIQGPSITRLAVGAAFLFDNALSVAEMDVGELLATFENAVSFYPHVYDGRFPQIAGASVEFDPARPPVAAAASLSEPSRIRTLVVHRAGGEADVVVAGYSVQGDPERRFVFGTTSFQMAGGDGYRAMQAILEDPQRPVHESEWGQQRIFEEYLARVHGGMVDLPDPPPDPRVAAVDEGSGEPMGMALAGDSLSLLFRWSGGEPPGLQSTGDIASGRWTLLEEGKDYQAELHPEEGTVSILAPRQDVQRFFRLAHP